MPIPTMRPVRVLTDDLVDQIAAGEVVERPASVVKELVENAIDAGSLAIQVDIENGGIATIRVSDDGHGMLPEDARLAVRRHATSKIATHADLQRIVTLGFRGEALPSIASVSRFVLVTRPHDAIAGTEIRIEGGSDPVVREVGAPPGTTVTVRDLFYNVPARRKFLKSPGAEAAQIRDVLIRASLARPELRMTLTRDGRRALELLPVADVAARARALFPDEKLTVIEGTQGDVSVVALLSAPERARNDSRELYLYVNGRPVRDRALGRAVAFAYGSVVPPGRYPVGVVHVRIPPERVDVNVHPQKTEVRFDDARAVLDAITRILARGLGTSPWQRDPRAGGPDHGAKRLGFDTVWLGDTAAGSSAGRTERTAFVPSAYAFGTTSFDALPVRAPPTGSPSPAPHPYEAGPAPNPIGRVAEGPPNLAPNGACRTLRVIGQVARTYLVCEADDRLVILDQHAADERVRFDRLRAQYAARRVSMQRLLVPERFEVSAEDATRIEEEPETFAALGIDVTRIGETTIAVHAVPALVGRAPAEPLVRDLLSELARAGERTFGDAIDTMLATMACHGAIRAGDALSPEECRELVHQLEGVRDFASHCPHGRPVAFEISFTELGRRVGR